MKSLRLTAELESRLERAAAIRGESLSEFIRRGAAERADVTLAADPVAGFSDVLGAVRSDGGRARRTGEAFGQVLADRSPAR